MRTDIIKKIGLGLIVSFIILTVSRCGIFDTKESGENQPPNTTLANIPVDNDTLFALVKLSWDGEDDDGFIATYRYRFTTFAMRLGQKPEDVKPDSITVTEWEDTAATSVVIAFNSPAEVNYQIFEVAAVDNDGNIDPTPATKTFFTFPTFPPETKLLVPETNREDRFVKPTVDEWWQGVFIRYTATDRDGEVIEYAWKVNDGDWHWTTDTAVFIAPEEFGTQAELDGRHTISVISKDNTLLVDPIGDSKEIDLFLPSFEKDILLMDETREDISLPNFNGKITDAIVDSFYFDTFGGNDRNLDILEWDFNLRGMPSFRRLQEYKMIVWHKDQFGESNGVFANRKILEDYLRIGGKLVIMGTRVLWQFMDDDDFTPPPFVSPVTPLFKEKNETNRFLHTFLHVILADVTSFRGDNGGITSLTGINLFQGEFRPDTSQIDNGFPFFNHITQTFVFQEIGGFTVPIIQYNGLDQRYDGLPCGIRYFGGPFDVIVLAFPLWHLQDADAKNIGNQILDSMGF